MVTGKLVAVNSFMSLNSFRIKAAAESIKRPHAGIYTEGMQGAVMDCRG